ncbi:MAG: hypothetical protein J5795_08660 [Lachnospiraceae bacterium]|nr:hypothetical protein [Lachnospiraceae bacterium]
MSEEVKAVRYKDHTKTKKIVIPIAVAAVFAFLSFYLVLPAINIFNSGFWGWLLSIIVVYLVSAVTCDLDKGKFDSRDAGKRVRYPFYLLLVIIAVLVIGSISSAKIFNARRYAGLIRVNTADFKDDMPETTNVNNIALMDTASASIIGNRTLGSLSQVVSQYVISSTYSQINYHDTPKKVANLEYADFFKWFQNRSNGIPGLVMVDPLNNSAEYVELAKPMVYADSAYFGKDLKRALRFAYPTKIFHKFYFEIDENGNPYYIVSCKTPHAGLFGAMDVNEVILFNPCDGTSQLYDVKDVPSWVDIVFDGDLASEKYNWYGNLSGGFWNSVFGNKDCKRATDDYGYIVLNDDVWYFTGVTSVNEDESNIGFILTNARTGEYKFYPVIGAEEYSAMHAAEGEVQEKGYQASFPSLINVGGQATYIMVLKDSGGLVKLYALVNVEKYSMVATGATQQEAMASYRKLLERDGINVTADENLKKVTVTVEDVRMITVDGLPTVYVSGDDGSVYKGYLNLDESLVLIRVGDRLNISCEESSVEKIYTIRAWNK